MLPAVAQGAIGVTVRESDAEIVNLLLLLNDPITAIAIDCERAFLAQLDGSCRTPIAGLAEVDGDTIHFRGLVLRPDGTAWHEVEMTGDAGNASIIGSDAGQDLLVRAGPNFLSQLKAR
jgi:hydroxymethylbilane synthase